jgi:hypothetical protein
MFHEPARGASAMVTVSPGWYKNFMDLGLQKQYNQRLERARGDRAMSPEVETAKRSGVFPATEA